ncbi:MAG: MtN3 and saliva related transmembrane protein [Alphaproteobacteria bacterium]|jgi:MtN3 and saliva related transmembrane protein
MQFIIELAQNNLNILGLAAGFLTTVGFALQVLKIIRTADKKSATMGISLLMYIVFIFGISLWIVYAFAINQWVMVMWNSITLALAATILFYTLRYNGPKWALIKK